MKLLELRYHLRGEPVSPLKTFGYKGELVTVPDLTTLAQTVQQDSFDGVVIHQDRIFENPEEIETRSALFATIFVRKICPTTPIYVLTAQAYGGSLQSAQEKWRSELMDVAQVNGTSFFFWQRSYSQSELLFTYEAYIDSVIKELRKIARILQTRKP